MLAAEEKPVNHRQRRLGSPDAAAARVPVALPNTGLNYPYNPLAQAYTGLAIPTGQYFQPTGQNFQPTGQNYPPNPAPVAQNNRHVQPAAPPAHRHHNRNAQRPPVPNREMNGNPYAAAGRQRPAHRNEKPNAQPNAPQHMDKLREQMWRHFFSQRNLPANAAPNPSNDYDLRFIVFRHGERIDQGVGRDWYDKIFKVDDAPPEAYNHPLLPRPLPHRSPSLIYQYDPPLSANGQQAALAKGQQLRQKNIKIDFCFSSPASRCVLTADALLQGLNQRTVPIRIHQHLFEPMNWNLPLKDLKGHNPFLTPEDWKRFGYNTDLSSQNQNTHLRVYGTEHEYFDRSKNFFDTTVQYLDTSVLPAQKQRGRKQLTILVVAHAATPKTLSYIARKKPLDVKTLFEQCKDVTYLQAATIFRNPTTHEWKGGNTSI